MTEVTLEQLERTLAQIEAGASIFAVIRELSEKTAELELGMELLAEGFAKLTAVMRGMCVLDAQQQAVLQEHEESLAKRTKPKPEEPGGKVN